MELAAVLTKTIGQHEQKLFHNTDTNPWRAKKRGATAASTKAARRNDPLRSRHQPAAALVRRGSA